MHVTERTRGDRRRIGKLFERERDAEQRDRLRAIALALDGRETLAIAAQLNRSRAFVQRWVYVYRDHGLESVRRRTPPGRQRLLTAEQEKRLAERVRRGAQADDRVTVLRGREFQSILEREFGVMYSLAGVYQVLRRLGFSSLQPRPRHWKQDPAAARDFRKSAPLFCGNSRKNGRAPSCACSSRMKRASASKAR